MLTVADIREMCVADHEGDDLDDAVAYYRMNYIEQQVFDILKKIDPNRYIVRHEFNTVIGTEDYSIPSGGQYDPNAAMPTNVKFDQMAGNQIFVIDANERVIEKRMETSWKSTEKGFYFEGTKIFLTPKPESTETIILPYFPELRTITENTDVLLLPEKFKKYYVEAFNELYTTQEEDYDISSVSQQKIREILEQIKREFPRKYSNVSKRKLDYSSFGL